MIFQETYFSFMLNTQVAQPASDPQRTEATVPLYSLLKGKFMRGGGGSRAASLGHR